MSLKIIFAGTPEFAVPSLQTLLDSSHEVIAVYTQPDRAAGRGKKVAMSPVKQLALENNIPVYQPKTLKDKEEQSKLVELNADVMIVIAYGLILPKAVLDAPRLGCINVHGSILPRWRGAAPIQHAILAGDKQTGITIMQMDEGLDTGDMLSKIICDIEDNDTSGDLHDKLAQLGRDALLETLNNISNITPEKQDNALANYASKINKQDGLIDWNEDATVIERKIRAYNPWPMSYTSINGQYLRILQAQLIDTNSQEKPGTIIQASAKGIEVAAGEQCINIIKLQLAGSKPMSVKDCLNSRASLFQPGLILGAE